MCCAVTSLEASKTEAAYYEVTEELEEFMVFVVIRSDRKITKVILTITMKITREQ